MRDLPCPNQLRAKLGDLLLISQPCFGTETVKSYQAPRSANERFFFSKDDSF